MKKLMYLSFAFVAILSIFGIISYGVQANGNPQETCPHTGDWIKFDGLTGMEFEAGAPEGMLITEWCYKASTEVVYGEVLPPAQSVLITSTVGHELSHVSIRVIELYYTPTNTPFSPPTETPTSTPEDTPTSTPGISPTPSDPGSPTPSKPTETVVPTLPPPPMKTPQLLPTTGGVQSPSGYMIFWLGLGVLGLGLLFKANKEVN